MGLEESILSLPLSLAKRGIDDDIKKKKKGGAMFLTLNLTRKVRDFPFRL